MKACLLGLGGDEEVGRELEALEERLSAKYSDRLDDGKSHSDRSA
jgi:hypothetical protein